MAISVPIISSFDGKGVSKAIRDFKKLEGAGNKMAFGLLNTNAVVNKGIAQFAKFGAAGAAVAGVIGGVFVKAALESQKVMKQTEAIVKATGGSANLTTKEISELSRVMSVKTGVDDEAIQTSMNMLLTFKSVRNEVGQGNDIFARASMAALDLGNVFGSTDKAAKQLGKALSNPVKGVSALRKSGVDFTDAQVKQIKTFVATGRVLDAQKLILKEVEAQVGGTAAATATDFDRMKVAVENLAEDLGTLLLPAFQAAARFVNENLVPILTTFSDIIGEKGLGAGFKYLGEQGLLALGKLNGWGDLVYGVVTAVIALNIATGIYTGLQVLATIAVAAFGSAATKAAFATGGLAAAMNLAFFGIPAVIGLVVVALVALALRFKGFRDLVIPALKSVINFFLDAFVNPFIKGINYLIKAWNFLNFSDTPLLSELEIGSDKAKKSVESLGDELTKLKPKLKLTAGAVLPKTTKKTGGGDDTTAMDKAKTALEKYTSALKLFGSETKALKDAVKGITTSQLSLANATDDVRVAQDKFNKVSKGYGAGSKEAATATRDLADANRSAVRATLSLRDATRGVADAQKELNDQKSKKGLIDAQTELTDATKEVQDAEKDIVGLRGRARKTMQDKLEKALERQKEAQEEVNEQTKLYTPETLTAAEEKLTTAILDEEDAKIALKDANQDVIDKQKELTEVVNGAAADSQKYKDAQKELTDAQRAERDAVDELADAYDRQAEAVRKLKDAKDALIIAGKGTTGKQEKGVQEALGINPNLTDGTGSNFVGGLPSIDFANMDFAGFDFASLDFASIFPNGFPMLAEGGIVNKPTLAMIGESGGEAVIPLAQLGKMGGSTNVTINVNGGDPNAVVDALRKYMRQNGSIPIRTSNIF